MNISDVICFKQNNFSDSRGNFEESYNKLTIKKIIKKDFNVFQQNISISKYGVLRGMHYQTKNIQAKITSAGSYDDMYEAPTETTSLVKSIKLFNTHSGALDVDIKIYDASSTTDYEWDKVNVLASGSVNLLTFNNIIILEAGDKIKMQCATGNVIKMTASVLQTSRT